MPNYYEPQVEALNLPLVLIAILATAPIHSSEDHLNMIPYFYTPASPITTNWSSDYYDSADTTQDELNDLKALKGFADKLIAQTVPLPDDAAAALNKHFWELI